MKLRLPHKFQAALIAALASVSFTTLSTGAAYAEESPLTFGADLGDVMYVGDSITHGIAAASWRWSMHKILVDAGVSYDENGYNTGNDSNYSGGLEPGTPYGGVAFENVHSAHSGGDAFEVIGRAKRGSGHYGNSNIYNWLGVDKQLTVRGSSTGSYTGTVTENVDTFLMLIGTNDLLSAHTDKPTEIAGSASDALVTDIGNIYGVMQQTNPGSQLVLLSIPCWTDHANNNSVDVHQAVVTANNKLKTWAESQSGVLYADVNEGLVDVSSDVPFKGPRAFFRSPTGDGLHPNAQGELIIAGNVAKAMGYAGRSVGLERSSATQPGSVTWTSAETPITVGTEAYVAEGAQFTTALGYTVDFSAVYGNGGTDEIWNNTDAFSITVGDGIHSGTLSLTEAYVKWGDKLLYSRDNSESGNFRIAYINNSINAADNVTAGYYVWLGDKLIGEGLAASGTASGISMQATGAGATVSTLSWTDAAYAPITTGYVNNDAAFKLVQVNPSPSHDNPVKVQEDFTGAEVSTTLIAASAFAHPEQKSSTSANASGSGQWFAGANALDASGYTGNLALEITGSAGGNAIFGIVHSGKTSRTVTGDVTMQMSSTGTIAHSTNGASSIIGGYYGSITGKFRAVVNSGTLQYGITGGYHIANAGDHIGSVEIDINGGSVQGNVYGGSINTANGKIDGNIDIIVTGGTVTGSIIGTGTTGTIGGESINITLTGGVVNGDVTGRYNGFTGFNGTTSVTVDGSLAYIGGDISADIVTVKDVASSPEHYTDRFDSYRGTIRADKVVLHNYTVDQMLASLETKSLVLSGASKTTVSNLTLTACDIHVDADSVLTLDGVNTYGNTATYNGHVAIADGTTFNVLNAEMIGGASGYSDGDDGYANGTFVVFKQATDEPPVDGTGLYGTDGGALTSANTDTFIGIGALTDAIFSYNGETGMLTADAQGIGGPYFVNTDHVVYSSTSTDYHAYKADDIRLNGGTLNFGESLKDGATITVAAAGSGMNLAAGTSVKAAAISFASGVSGFALSGEGELILTAANAEQILTTVTGDGTMHLVENAVLDGTQDASAAAPKASVSTGTFIVGNGAGSDQVRLQIGRTATGGGYVANYATIKSFQHVTLDNGQLWFHTNNNNGALTVNGLTVTENGGSIYLQDVNAASTIKLAGTTNLQGNLTYTNNWKDNTLDVDKLTGSGDFTVTVNNNTVALQLRDVTGWSGTMDLSTGGSKSHYIKGDSSLMSLRQRKDTGTYYIGTGGAASFNALTLDAGTATFRLNNGTAKSVAFDSVTLGTNAKLSSYYNSWDSSNYASVNLSIGSLTMTGDAATVGTTNHGGLINIGSITGNGTLTLTYESSSDVKTVFNLGGADVTTTTFSGTLDVYHNNNGDKRNTTLILNDAYTAANAVVQFRAVNAGGNKRALGIGINADTVKVAGLNDGTIGTATGNNLYSLFSGSYTGLTNQYDGGTAFYDNAGDGKMRTLEITGAGGTTGIKVHNNVSLAMSGSGTQTFTGDMSLFNGSINVTNGTLNLTPSTAIATHGVNVGKNGVLAITAGTITANGTMYNEGTLTLTGYLALNPANISAYEQYVGTDVPAAEYDGQGDYAGSGYLKTSSWYYLVKGGEFSALNKNIMDITGGAIVQEAGTAKDIVVTLDVPGTRTGTYYVNGALNYDSTEMGGATTIQIASAGSLSVAGTAVSDLFKNKITGTGTLVVSDNTTITDGGSAAAPYKTAFAGTLKIADGKTFQLGDSKDNDYFDLTSVSEVVIGEGSTLKLNQHGMILQNVTTTGGTANLYFEDTKDKNQDSLHITGVATIADGSTLDINSGWKNHVSIEKLAGSGTLHFGRNQEERTYNINGMQVGDTLTRIKVDQGTLNINNQAFVQTQGVEMADAQQGTTALNITKGAVLNVTGSDNGTNYKSASLLLGEWSIATTVNVEGSLVAANAQALVGDAGMTITIADGGVMAVKGIGIANRKNDTTQSVALTLQDGGTLILGDAGISADKSASYTLNAGEIGISAATATITPGMALNSATGTTFNTARYTVGTDGTVAEGTTGGTLTVNGVLGGTGKLVKAGEGTLKLTGANTYSGGTEVNGGTLAVGAASALPGAVNVAGGATLSVETNNVALDTVTLQQGATLKSDNGSSAEMAGLSIGTLNVAGDASITKNTWSTQMSVGALNGAGNLQVNLGTDHNAAPSMLQLTGAGNYSGELNFHAAQIGTAHHRAYGQFLEIASGNALAGAVLNLTGESGAVASAALNDTTVNLAGLKGDQYSYIYSGATPAATSADAPAGDGTDRTLAITTAQDARYDYAGSIGANVNLQINGAGTQVLSGNNTAMTGSVTVNGGTLAAASANALAGTGAVLVGNGGTLELASGLTNTIGGNLTLNEGATLTLAGENNFSVGGNLTLEAGSILNLQALESHVFDYTKSLTLGSVTGTIDQANLGSVVLDWNVDAARNAALGVDSGNLVITLSSLTQDLIWHGGSHNWSDQNWHTAAAPDTTVNFNEHDTVAFNGGTADTVTLTEDAHASRMTLANGSSKLTVNTGGHNLTVDNLVSEGDNKFVKTGAGTATFSGDSKVQFSELTINSNAGTTVFNQKVYLHGGGTGTYWFNANSNTEFNDGISMSGSSKNGYALLVGGGTITMGGTTDISDYNIGLTNTTAKMIVKEGASVTVNGFLNSTSNDNNGNLVVSEGATFTAKGNTFRAYTLVNSGTLVQESADANKNRAATITTLAGSVTTFNGEFETDTFNAQGGNVTFGKTATISALTASGGVVTNIDNKGTTTVNSLIVSKANADAHTGISFTGHLTVGGTNRVEVGYSNTALYQTAVFENGFDYTGSNDYALLVGNANTVTLGGDSNWGSKTVGMAGTGKIILRDNATATMGRVFNSGSDSNNGTLELGNGSVFSITGTSADNRITGITNNGGTLNFANNLLVDGTVTGNGTIAYTGTAAKTLTLNNNSNVNGFTGTFKNTGTGNLTISLPNNAATALGFAIERGENAGYVDVTLGKNNQDYTISRTWDIHNMTQAVSNTLELVSGADVTVTGKLTTGRLWLGKTAQDSDAVFTLSGADAELYYNSGSHTYSATVQGYGTFAVVDGATQTLGKLNASGQEFHGTLMADGEGSTLTLTGSFASDVKLQATNGGVIKLTESYTMGDNVAVDGGTLNVEKGLVVNGSADLSAGTLNQTGGTVTVNEGKRLTLGEASITSAISNSGTVNFTKDITSSGLAKEGEDDTFRVGADDNRATNDNYFLEGTRTESTLRVVSGGTVNPAGHTVTQDNVAYALKADGTATGVSADTVDYGTFYQGEAGSTLQSSLITSTAEAHEKLMVGVVVDRANLIVDSALYFLQVADANITNTVETDNIPVLQIAGGDNTLVGHVTSLPEMTLFVRGAAGSLKMQNATATPYEMKAGSDITFADNGSVTVRAAVAEEGSEQFDVYSLNNSRFTVEADTMQAMNTTDQTVNNHLKVASIATGDAGSLSLANGVEETLKNVTALSGDITFLNMAEARGTTAGEQTQVRLDGLYIGSSKTVSFYENDIADAAQEAKVTVSDTLTAKAGAKLNADLVMESRSTLDVSGTGGNGLAMGSSVTLNEGMTLKDYSSNWATWEIGTTYTLFTGVDSLDIGSGAQTTAIDYTQWVDARQYFTNIEEVNRYFLCYTGADSMNSGVGQYTFNGSNVGTVYIMVMPEPTTGTLSLLALAALAARRRRK